MPLTVKDILEKTFKRSFKGYDEDEVDKFLDVIIDEFKLLQNENTILKKELSEAKGKAKQVKDAEETIMNTLVTAQKSSERMMKEAARKAELILDNAENTAKQRVEETTQSLAEAERKLEAVKRSASSFANSFANMVNSQAASFEKTYQSYFGDIDTYSSGGINSGALERIDNDIATSLKDISQSEPEQEVASVMPEPEQKPEPPVHAEPPQRRSKERAKPSVDAQQQPVKPMKDTKDKGLMELHEINKALNDLEQGTDILQDSYSQPAEQQPEQPAKQPEQPVEQREQKKPQTPGLGEFKPKYDDYSWLYENDDKKDDMDFELSFKDPKEKEELKSLIDEVME